MSSWFDSYKSWVQSHAKFVGTAEDALSHLSWLFPDRFAGSELLLESFHSVVGLISLWHESIANDTIGNGPPWPILLGALRKVEVLVEMRANYVQNLTKWNKYGPLFVLEVMKSVLRMLVYRMSKARLMLDQESDQNQGSLSPSFFPVERAPAIISAFERLKAECVSIPSMSENWPSSSPRSTSQPLHRISEEVEDEVERHDVTAGASASSQLPNEMTGSHQTGPSANQSGQTEGPSESANRLHWWLRPARNCPTISREKVIEETASHIYGGGPELQYALGERMVLVGEILHLLRPVLYVMALGRYGERAWRGWFVSLSVDMLARGLLSYGSEVMRDSGLNELNALNGLNGSPPSTLQDRMLTFLLRLRNFEWSPFEEDELKRRRRLLLLYLLRSPFFDVITRRALLGARRFTTPLPLVGLLVSKGVEILFGVQQYYSYTSGS